MNTNYMRTKHREGKKNRPRTQKSKEDGAEEKNANTDRRAMDRKSNLANVTEEEEVE